MKPPSRKIIAAAQARRSSGRICAGRAWRDDRRAGSRAWLAAESAGSGYARRTNRCAGRSICSTIPQLADRVYGPTLTLKVCERAAQAGLPLYLYGSKQSVLDALVANLKQKFPALRIAGLQPSRFRNLSAEEKMQVVETIRLSGAAITLVGLGCPRQEVWAYEHRELLSMPIMAVGAAFDFHAGTLAQAPPRMQRLGLEWLYRLAKEPSRLWKRYLLLNPHYLWLLGQQLLHVREFPLLTATPPVEEVRYG